MFMPQAKSNLLTRSLARPSQPVIPGLGHYPPLLRLCIKPFIGSAIPGRRAEDKVRQEDKCTTETFHLKLPTACLR